MKKRRPRKVRLCAQGLMAGKWWGQDSVINTYALLPPLSEVIPWWPPCPGWGIEWSSEQRVTKATQASWVPRSRSSFFASSAWGLQYFHDPPSCEKSLHSLHHWVPNESLRQKVGVKKSLWGMRPAWPWSHPRQCRLKSGSWNPRQSPWLFKQTVKPHSWRTSQDSGLGS